MVPCGLSISSDPRLLEQMIRNLLSNALKYTKRGKVLLGCRRHKGMLSIEVWDTGIGIPDDRASGDLRGVPPARQRRQGTQPRSRSRSVHRASAGWALGHQVRVRSRPGRGSVFSIEVKLALSERARHPGTQLLTDKAKGNAPHWLDPGHRGRSGRARTSGGLPSGRGP